MRVLLDIDGVVANFNRKWQEIAERDFGRKPIYNQTLWYPDGAQEIMDKIMAGTEVWADGKPYPGVVQRLWDLWEEGIDFYAVTRVPEHAHQIREDWLFKHNVPIAALHSVRHGESKAGIATQLGLVASIDDNQDNARELMHAGLHSFLLARHWNKPEEGLDRVTWRCLPERLRELREKL